MKLSSCPEEKAKRKRALLILLKFTVRKDLLYLFLRHEGDTPMRIIRLRYDLLARLTVILEKNHARSLSYRGDVQIRTDH